MSKLRKAIEKRINKKKPKPKINTLESSMQGLKKTFSNLDRDMKNLDKKLSRRLKL